MQTILVIIVALLPFAAEAAEKPNSPKPVPSTLTPKSARTGNPCAEYGAGFVRVEGTSTCVKIGGSVSVGVGSTMPAR